MSSNRARRVQPIVAPTHPRLRSATLAAGTGFAVLIAGLAVWMSDAPPASRVPTALPDTAAVAAEADEQEAATLDDELEPIALPLVAYELFLARDPFEPVVPEPEPAPTEPSDPNDAAGNGDGNGDSSGAANGNSTSGNSTSGNSTSGNGDAVTPSCTRGAEVVCDGRVLTIVEVLEENGEMVAVIQVNTMRWRVTVGDVFADVFQVLSISADEVRVLYGDRIVTILARDNALK
ncbi:MAG: hypothetical protein ACNA8R_04805 [Nitriliruptoraceae bacterium]